MEGKRIEIGNGLDLIKEKRDEKGEVLKVGREYLDSVKEKEERKKKEVDIMEIILMRKEIGEKLKMVEKVEDINLKGNGSIGLEREDKVDER